MSGRQNKKPMQFQLQKLMEYDEGDGKTDELLSDIVFAVCRILREDSSVHESGDKTFHAPVSQQRMNISELVYNIFNITKEGFSNAFGLYGINAFAHINEKSQIRK